MYINQTVEGEKIKATHVLLVMMSYKHAIIISLSFQWILRHDLVKDRLVSQQPLPQVTLCQKIMM